MLTSDLSFLQPELMDVVRLFEGAQDFDIVQTTSYEDGAFRNIIDVDGKRSSYCDAAEFSDQLQYKSLCKRYAKLALYEALSEKTGISLPWGALTGIRPTRLAYQELEAGRSFEPLFARMHVSEDNTALVRRVIEGQRGIYDRREGNCDLFVSLPFCPTKCEYCSFITAPIAATRKYLPDYLESLSQELAASAPLIGNLRSVYIGGGTPFALEAQELEDVLKAVAPLRTNGCEYTVEAGRPDTFTREKLDVCRKYGVTRICINAQSFSDATLARIGRKHTAQAVRDAFALAAPYGFSVNCDLIAGLTDESYEEFCASVDEAIALAPDNITVHTLCLKKGARLKEETSRLEEGRLSDMIDYSRRALTAAGYEPYYLYRQKYMAGAHENVGWTKPGKACVYNVDVMEETCDNLAVGANAVSKKLFSGGKRIERHGSPKDIPTYLAKTPQLIRERAELFGAEEQK